jgi:hypothetical protein
VDDEVEAARPEHVTSIMVTHQIRDAFYGPGTKRRGATAAWRSASRAPSAPGSRCFTRNHLLRRTGRSRWRRRTPTARVPVHDAAAPDINYPRGLHRRSRPWLVVAAAGLAVDTPMFERGCASRLELPVGHTWKTIFTRAPGRRSCRTARARRPERLVIAAHLTGRGAEVPDILTRAHSACLADAMAPCRQGGVLARVRPAQRRRTRARGRLAGPGAASAGRGPRLRRASYLLVRRRSSSSDAATGRRCRRPSTARRASASDSAIDLVSRAPGHRPGAHRAGQTGRQWRCSTR